MANPRFFMHPVQTASSMSLAHPYTIVAPGDDDDDNDICPVCDGECTCPKIAPTQLPAQLPHFSGPLSMAELSMRYTASTVPGQILNSPSSGLACPPSTPTPLTTPTPAPKPSLKIKLTVPPSMLSKRRQPIATTSSSASSNPKKLYKSAGKTTLDFVNDGYNSASDSQDHVIPTFLPRANTPPRPAPKKRGRPPKSLAAVRKLNLSQSSPYKPLNPKSAAPGKQQKRSSSAKVRKNIKARVAIVKKVGKRRKAVTSEEESSESAASDDGDIDLRRAYNDNDAESVQFPTFVSASALSSLSSDGSDSSTSLTDFDSDSSIEAEEENFIMTDVHDKARLKRELLGDGDPSMHKRRTGHNNEWVIRPRKKSVGPSDAEMDVDSDATEDEDEEEDGEEGDNAEAEADATEDAAVAFGIGMSMEEDEEETDEAQRHRYVGLATGWSEDDDESSCDADIFFANLSGSESDSSESSSSINPSRVRRLGPPFAMSMGEDGDQSDISECTESGAGRIQRPELESLPFEISESWDGQVVFTNGSRGSQGLADLAFEAEAGRFLVDSSASPSQTGEDHTTDASPRRRKSGYMHSFGLGMSDADDSDVDMSDSDGGYLEEDGEGEGDTTDEELVGENDLPNERAMALISLPLSVSAINPLSTVSPAVNVGRRRRAHDTSLERRRKRWGMESPRAADILAGKVPFWDSEEEAEMAAKAEEVRGRGLVRGSGGARTSGVKGESRAEGAGSSGSAEDAVKIPRTPTGPRRGVFLPSTETKQAIIGEEKNGAEVPSPHPRFKGRGRPAAGRVNSVEHLLRRHLLQTFPAPSPSISAASVATGISSLSPMADERSPLQMLLSSGATASGSIGSIADLDEVLGGALTASCDGQPIGGAQPIGLDDVLEASFLDDSDHARDTPSALSVEESAAAAAKNLNRWDVISVGAFRQTRENGWDGRHTPGSSADFGNAMRSSPLNAMMWQNTGLASGSSSVRPLSASAPNTIKGNGSKLAKRRRLMMSASTMSSPLILPLSGDRTPNSTPTSTSLTKHTPMQSPNEDNKNHHQYQQKNRKELRRERKLLKRKSYGAVHQQHSNHQFHSHHHHPNAKTRGTSSSQRSNFFSVSVPPLNL